MIWIIGGTKDSRDIINKLGDIEIIVSTATEYGKKLLKGLNVVSEPMNKDEMRKFIRANRVDLVLDASHPYAVNVSQNAIEASTAEGIDYLRFEREMLNYDGGVKFTSMEELTKYLGGLKEKILVTLGSNNLSYFKDISNLENIYFRILPVKESLEKAEKAGILPKQLIAVQGPFSKAFNTAIYKNYEIKYVVTKESGSTGGELEKIEAAADCRVKPIILSRPEIDYPWKTGNIDQIIKKVMEYEEA
ncbi:precorrin-6A reductase [Ilyobacter polytropus]|uniref:Precorrin-6x reductase n=1 Tax=Ilyobacter polytropus (strain ATCC 51220 / DSM 2926 / LMG 16218 / CuHBu1) TaxID=572544 RepID=E3HDD2_ILYPC|nr:precorrin-6A reductase [Ilyobacter polytropus]ADO84132.1 precorrin-6x reductase [Ilyobacter polytropus DSM 2926]